MVKEATDKQLLALFKKEDIVVARALKSRNIILYTTSLKAR